MKTDGKEQNSNVTGPLPCLRLKFSQEITRTSLAYVLRSLPYLFFSQNRELYHYLQFCTLQTAAELAFQRCLMDDNVPFEKILASPFTQPDRLILQLGGRRTTIHAQLITSNRTINRLAKDASLLLDQKIPVRDLLLSHLPPSKASLHVFCFILAKYARSKEDAHHAILAGKPVYWLHLLPLRWRKPARWKPLDPLAIEANLGEPLSLELGGQDHRRDFSIETIDLNPGVVTQLTTRFYSLCYLHSSRLPEGNITIFSQSNQRSLKITPDRWRNAWLYGKEIFFMGYLTSQELRVLLSQLSFTHSQASSSNSFTASHLHPLDDLFKQLLLWSNSGFKK
jgi:hypothetical protein